MCLTRTGSFYPALALAAAHAPQNQHGRAAAFIRAVPRSRDGDTPFTIAYTPMPRALSTRGTRAAWRDYADGETVTVQFGADGDGVALCSRSARGENASGGRPCENADELALLPPPPTWLAKVLMTYPCPLLPDSPADPGGEVHCSS